jgi:hypothetical protein
LDENPTLLEDDFNRIIKNSAERERLTEINLNIFHLSADFLEKPFKWLRNHNFFGKWGFVYFSFIGLFCIMNEKNGNQREKEGRVYEKTVPYCGNSTKKGHA